MRKKSSPIYSSRIILVIFIVIASFLAAFIGQILTDLWGAGPSLTQTDRFIIRQGGETLIEKRKEARDRILNQEVAGVIEVYSGNYIKLGNGFVVTNDGWLITTQTDTKPAFVRGENNEMIAVKNIENDPASELQFIQVDSQSLRSITFAANSNIDLLEEYLTLGFRGDLNTTISLQSKFIEDTYVLSDKLNRFNIFTNTKKGDLVYNDSAEVIAYVVSEEGQAINVNYLREKLEEVLRNNQIDTPVLNVTYIDLSQKVVSESLSKGNTTGALITTPSSGLLVNDIIISINGSILDEQYSLSDAIVSSSIGDTLDLGIIRRSEPVSISITLE